MRSTVGNTGETTIPRAIVEQLQIHAGAVLDWVMVDGSSVRVTVLHPVESSPAIPQTESLPEELKQAAQIFGQELSERHDPDLSGGPGAQVMTVDEFLALKT